MPFWQFFSMRTFGLIGYPLGHSWSAGYFARKFQQEGIIDAQYLNFPLDNLDKLAELLQKERQLLGLNVTIPYKEKIIPQLDSLVGAAQRIAAVNCIKVTRNAGTIHLSGYNTDVEGFEKSLMGKIDFANKKALILGTGGAAKAAEWVLNKHYCQIVRVSRAPIEGVALGYDDITQELLNECTLIINATPLGMMPNQNTYPPLPYQWLQRNHFLFDMVYNPTETEFLKKGKAMGCQTLNGLEMLHLQAEAAWAVWNS